MTATTPETTVETLPYKNPDLPASERIADPVSYTHLTLPTTPYV